MQQWIKDLGTISGLISLSWLTLLNLIKFIMHKYKRPKIIILDAIAKPFQFPGGACWYFGVLDVKVERVIAKRCIAILNIIEGREKNKNFEKTYSLHWASNPYTPRTTGASCIDMGEEVNRLDVVFTRHDQPFSGCWIAVEYALNSNPEKNQFYMPPGEYLVEIKIKCDDGKEVKRKYKIMSPNNWQDLIFFEC